MKNLYSYKSIIVDMDGTLYYRLPLRILMIMNIILHCIFHPFRIKEIIVVRYFRKIRENKDLLKNKDFKDVQYELISHKFKISVEETKSIINFWLMKKPLKYLNLCKDKNLGKIIDSLHEKKIKIIVYSDYPALEKVKVLNIKADYIYSSEDENILSLKPNPKALEYINKNLNLSFSDMLIVGDRYEKDGKLAEYYEVDFIILPQNRFKRNKIYRRLAGEFNGI
ncbi:MAG: HAD family hydrolase [Endomicrobium sp.]|nr:HAD family hydrolase [Endomicrobium sp.]